MPRCRSTRLALLVLGLSLPLVACGTSPEEEPATTTTEVSAAAGSGFCLTWARYREALGAWLLEPPQSVDEAAATASATLRAADEARSEAPEDLREQLDEVVSTMEAVEDVIGRAEALPDAQTDASALLDSTDLRTATDDVTAWVDESC